MRRSLLIALALLLISSVSTSAQSGRGFGDEFNGNQLDSAKWDVFKGSPTVAGGALTLNGGATRAEIQSKRSFLYGALTIALESANFKAQSGNTDSSFGVEIFTGVNGQCHFSVVLKANGQLAYDARTDCDGFAVYFPRDAQTNLVLWRYAASSAAPPLAAVSAASYSGAMLAPDSITSLFGTAMARTTQIAGSLPLPTTLAGSQVVVRDAMGNARAAPLFFVSPTQINFLVPPGTATGVATVKAVLDDGFVACGLIAVTNVAPGLFTANASGQGVASALALRVKPNGMQSYEPVARFDPAQNRFVPVPIDLGPEGDQVFLILYGAGIRYHSGLANVAVTIGGAPVGSLYAGPVPGLEGLDQVNLLLPRSLMGRGEVDVVMTVDGKAANAVRVSFK